LCFFFSSRRRHTRSKRDWSSDVCSSDLVIHERHHVGRFCVYRCHPGLVNHREVITISGIFHLNLPVTLEPEFMNTNNLGWETVELLKETLHPNLGVSQVLIQRWCILVKRGKDHAHVGLRTQFLQREI